MRTARSLPYGGVVSVTETPLDRDPPDRDPFDRQRPPQQTETPGQRPRPPWTDRHLWKHNFRQTSFAGSN